MKIYINSILCVTLFFFVSDQGYSSNDISVGNVNAKPTMDRQVDLGKTIENPIDLSKIKNRKDAEEFQKSYIEKYYSEYRILSEGMVAGLGGADIQVIGLRNDDGDEVQLYFDVSGVPLKMTSAEKKQIMRLHHGLKSNDSEKEEFLIGTTFENPYILDNMKTEESVRSQQARILKKDYPDHQIIRREIWLRKNRFIERLSLKKGDKIFIINFDVSDYMREKEKQSPVHLIDLSPGVKKVVDQKSS